MPFVVCILLTAITVLALSWCGPDPCSTRAFALLCFLANCMHITAHIYILYNYNTFVYASCFWGDCSAILRPVRGKTNWGGRNNESVDSARVRDGEESGRERNVNSAKKDKKDISAKTTQNAFSIFFLCFLCFLPSFLRHMWHDLDHFLCFYPRAERLQRSSEGAETSRPFSFNFSRVRLPFFHFSFVWPVFSSTTQYRALSTTQYHCILFFNFPSFQRLHVACSSFVPRLFFVELLVEQTTCKLPSREKIRSKTTEWSNLQMRISRTKRSIVDGGPSQCYEMTQIGSDCIAPIDSSPGRQAIGQQCLNLQRSHR